MKNKSIIIISIILFTILFLAFVFPRLEFFSGIPVIVQTIFRILIYIGVLSYLIFIIQELYHWRSRCDLAEKTLDSRRSSISRDDEFAGELSLKLKIDPDQNYNEIIAQILKIAQSSLMARSAFLYLFNADEHTYILQAYQSQEGIEFRP